MDDMTGLRATLNDSDPAKDITPTAEARHRARTDALALLKENTPVARPLWRRIPVLVAGAATAALAVGAGTLLLPENHPNGVPAAYAAPPETVDVVGGEPVEGTEALLELAEVAAGRGPASGEGDVAFISSTGTTMYRMNADAGDDGPEETHGYGFIPFDWERWEDMDGGTLRNDHPKPPTETGGEAGDHEWFMDRVGESHESTLHPSLVLPRELPTDPDTLARTLLDLGTTPEEDRTDESLFLHLTQLYESRPLSGEEEAAVQRIIADRAEVSHLGTATDPLDREGELFSFTVTDEFGTTSEYRLLYDEEGSLLYYDSTLRDEEDPTTPIEDYGLEYPVLKNQVAFVWTGWVEGVGDRP
ncbi:CU044_5270 family protein [Nocardiopsis sp. MG754419]|uniref:CU044_5270 family protein n=1 Tax=Nocardiopsis sp. MG754419 TaxID=2259865 RepID=UPI001BAB3A6B|nr:CU044_5270 family protein [Nocardiopsis sp. MG754419]MBR8745401.1 hypothetical protein [Nocardiopsis sp. MG754419]